MNGPTLTRQNTVRTIFGLPFDSGVILQGASGRSGSRHFGLMQEAGSNMVAGISQSRRMDSVHGKPLYTSCAEAVANHGARISVIMVPPLNVLGAMEDAVEAGIELIVTNTEGMPLADALRAKAMVDEAGVRWIGSSTPGLAVPGRMKLGFLPDAALSPGGLGVASKSGTLSYEVSYRLVSAGLGQAVWVGVGGDPVKGTRFADLLPYFASDPAVRAMLVIGEVGGTEEEDLAAAIQESGFSKPVYAIIAGKGAREGISMGHAGAMIVGKKGTFQSKAAALRSAGVHVSATLKEITEEVLSSQSSIKET